MSYYNFPKTDYFKETRKRKDRKQISEDMIGETIMRPQRIKMQENGRVSFYRFIKAEWKVLRVITLRNGAIFNCYWDRDQMNKKNRVHYPIPKKKTNYNKYYPKKQSYAY